MEQKLSTNIRQRMALSARLQQTVRMLQLSTADLRVAIEKEYMENPVLEMDESSMPEEGGLFDGANSEELSALAEYIDGDEFWQGYADEEHRNGFEAAAPMAISLEEELLEQAKFTFSTERELEIGSFIIGSLDSNGYLAVPINEIERSLRASKTEVLQVLRVIQTFEPSGVGARDLEECLRIQAEGLGIYEGIVAALIERHLDDVAASKIKQIARDEGCGPEDVQAAVDLIRGMNPKPGGAYGGAETSYVTPEVRIQKENGEYTVIWNDNYIPRLHISDVYKKALKSGDNETKDYIRKRMESAKWLMNNIEQRRETVLRVVKEIVKRQRDFLDNGPDCMKPMTMSMVAEALGIHESTVSRAVSGKYAQLPRGVFPLRGFFTSHASGETDQENASVASAKAALKKFLDAEDPKHPLSDQKLAELLEAQAICISRRTVMKYREQMGYASSVKRKRY